MQKTPAPVILRTAESDLAKAAKRKLIEDV